MELAPSLSCVAIDDHGVMMRTAVSLTGGEPTLHPELLPMLDIAREAGVRRVTVCSNGIRLVKDRAFSQALADRGARIALSFDTFDERADLAMQGARMLPTKLAAVDLCDEPVNRAAGNARPGDAAVALVLRRLMRHTPTPGDRE